HRSTRIIEGCATGRRPGRRGNDTDCTGVELHRGRGSGPCFFEKLLRRVKKRIHLKDEVASLNDLVDSTLLVELDRLVVGGVHSLADSRRERWIAWVIAHALRLRL